MPLVCTQFRGFLALKFGFGPNNYYYFSYLVLGLESFRLAHSGFLGMYPSWEFIGLENLPYILLEDFPLGTVTLVR